jgi:hypothetical protein
MSADAIVLGLLAIVDLAVLIHLRMRRHQRMQEERVARSLQLAVQRENKWVGASNHDELRRAS